MSNDVPFSEPTSDTSRLEGGVTSGSVFEPALEPETYELPLPAGWLDPDAAKVLRRLQHCGHLAYLVGGCVRDLLVGRYPKDFDVGTSALPVEVKRAFSNCRLIGRRFRLAHVLYGDKVIEVATFRRDPGSTDPGFAPDEDEELPRLRRNVPRPHATADTDVEPDSHVGPAPDEEVETLDAADSSPDEDLLIRSDNVFGTPREDALRRDFTINSLFYDVSQRLLIDWAGGMRDIETRTIRTIGIPEIRFREDPVRMLRAVKFAAALRFSIEPRTWEALCLVAPDIMRAAPPRILEEIFRMGRGGAAVACFRLMALSGLLRYILPELEPMVEQELAAQAAGAELAPIPLSLVPKEEGAVLPRLAPTMAVPGVLNYLRALDRVDQASAPLPNHIMLAMLCLPVVLRVSQFHDELSATEEIFERAGFLLDELANRLRVSRREREKARLVLLGFMKLLWRSSRGAPLQGLSKKSYFAESLSLFALHCLALERGLDELQKLAQRVSISPEVERILAGASRSVRPSGPAPVQLPEAENDSEDEGPDSLDVASSEGGEAPRPRRRRRRRGKGRGGERSEGGSERSAAPPRSEPTE